MNNETIDVAQLGVQLDEVMTLEQRLAAFGEILEIGEPVSRQVLFGALQDANRAKPAGFPAQPAASPLLVVESSRRGDSRTTYPGAFKRQASAKGECGDD